MSVKETENILKDHIDGMVFVVLWSSSDYDHIKNKTKGGVIQFIGVFSDEKFRPQDFVRGLVVCVDEKTGNIRFSTDSLTNRWETFRKYIVDMHNSPQILQRFSKRHAIDFSDERNKKWHGRKWMKSNALGTLFHKGGDMKSL